MKPYYYIYKHGDQGPRVRHHDLEAAQEEAERLAEKEPGKVFEILRCVGLSSTSKASTFWIDGEGPPEKPRYRMLERGEIYQVGDEWRGSDLDEWKFIEATLGTKKYTGPHQVRRPL